MPSTIRVPNLPAFLDSDSPAADDLVIVYDSSTGITRKALISDLPFTNGGAGGVVTYASGLWKVHTYSPGFIYDDTAGNCFISDLRLLGITDGVISSTQVSGEFRDSQLEFDGDAGMLTVKNFELVPNEHITININGAVNYAYNTALQTAVKNIADHAAMLSPFKPIVTGANGGKVLWLKPANEIPLGWQECVVMRGKLPVGQDLTDTDYQNAIGTPGGAKTLKVDKKHLPAEGLFMFGNDVDVKPEAIPPATGTGDYVARARNYNNQPLNYVVTRTNVTPTIGKTANLGNGEELKHLNPYRIVMWIEFIGLD